MAQKDLEVPGIPRDAFCDFFLSHKQKAFPVLFEQVTSLQQGLNAFLRDIPRNYETNFSSVERFSIRCYVNFFSQVLSSIQQSLFATQQQITRHSSVHKNVEIADIDIAIEEVYRSVVSVGSLFAVLNVPRTVEAIDADKLEDVPTKLGTTAFLLTRQISAKSAACVAPLRQKLDLFCFQCTLDDRCTKAFVKFSEPLEFNMIQVWKHSIAVQTHLASEELSSFLQSIEEFKSSDKFTITKIH